MAAFGVSSSTSGDACNASVRYVTCVALGGFVTVTSQLGAGTTFRFDFPRAALGDAYADTFEGSRAVA